MTATPPEHPPEPWHLRGQLVLALWPAPVEAVLPRLPHGVTPLIRKGRTLVGAAWVDYQPGGVLTYRELLVAVPVLHGTRPAITITDIWVDSPASLAGGRRLWGIPKELADFPRFDGRRFAAVLPGGGSPIAEGAWTAGRRLPGRWPAAYGTVQLLGQRLHRARVRSRSGVQLGSASMTVHPDGPLAHLGGVLARPPIRALALRDFRLTFGG